MAVRETVSHFNTGAASTASLLKAAGVVPSENMSALPNTDSIHIKEAAIKVSEKACLSRRKLRATKKSEGKAKVDYGAGGYGLSKEPEDSTTVKANNSKVLNISEFDFTVKINNDIVTRITFMDEDDKNIQWINDAI